MEIATTEIKITFNIKKSVCRTFYPSIRRKIVCDSLLVFTLAGCNVLSVGNFKYLVHIIDDNFSDDSDITRILKCLLARTMMLLGHF